jgi:hypothetical protein
MAGLHLLQFLVFSLSFSYLTCCGAAFVIPLLFEKAAPVLNSVLFAISSASPSIQYSKTKKIAQYSNHEGIRRLPSVRGRR